MRDKVTHPATPRELLRVLKHSDRGAGDIPPPPQGARHDWRARPDQGRPYRPARQDGPCRRPPADPRAAVSALSIPDKTGEDAPDVYVSSSNIKEAMHGDRVLARIERRTPENRLEGRIIRILERGNSTVVGRFDIDRVRPRIRSAVRSAHPDRRAHPHRAIAATRNRARWWSSRSRPGRRRHGDRSAR